MSTEQQQADKAIWLGSFLYWLHELYEAKLVANDASIIRLDDRVARRFGFGGDLKASVPPFIGVQQKEMRWFQYMPWQEAILDENSISMIVDPLKRHIESPPFAIRFSVDPRYAKVIARFRSLDVRGIKVDASGTVTEMDDMPTTKIAFTPGKVTSSKGELTISRRESI